MSDKSLDMERLQAQYEDSAVTLLVNLMMREEGGALLTEKQPGPEPPAGLDRRILGLIEKRFSAHRRRQALAAAGKTFSRVASVFLIVFILFSFTFANVSAVRDATLGFFTKTYSFATVISSTKEGAERSVVEFRPRWMPEGHRWSLTYFNASPAESTLEFRDEDGNEVNITMTDAATGSLVVDTEDAEVRRDIRINGSPSVLSVKNGMLVLSWIDEERGSLFLLSITGSEELLDPEIAKRIAENIK